MRATLWAEMLAGQHGFVTGNEHALHVGRMVLRHPHRQSVAAVTAWRISVPRLLTGWLPLPTTLEAQRFKTWLQDGRHGQVAAALHTIDAGINQRGSPR